MKALPERDPTIDALAPESRSRLATIWAQRAESELAAGVAFAAVARELRELDADPVVLELADQAAADEPRHAELCLRLAAAYAGAPAATPPPRAVTLPEHAGAGDALRKHLHAAGMCCINESIACAFIEVCLDDAAGPLVRAIHREHLSDEIEHARVGWAHFASPRVDAATRREVARWLPRLLSANLENWRSRIAWLPADGIAGHALPPSARCFEAARAAVRDVIIPGFAHVGIDAAHAAAWFASLRPQ